MQEVTITKQNIMILSAVIVVLLIIGFFVGKNVGVSTTKERLKDSPYGMALANRPEIKNVSGVIEKIDGNKIYVKIYQFEPLSDPNLDTRIVTVDSSTKIILNIQKDVAIYQNEMKDYQAQMEKAVKQKSKTPFTMLPPVLFNKEIINFTDLKLNQQVSVTAGTDIKDSKEFIATEIVAQAMPVDNAN